MKAITAIILAAGEGKRMHSRKQKVLHEICGRSMVKWVLAACEEHIQEKPIVSVGFDGDRVRAHIGEKPAMSPKNTRIPWQRAFCLPCP